MATFVDQNNGVTADAYPPRGNDVVNYNDSSTNYNLATTTYNGWDKTQEYPIPGWVDETT